MVGEEWWVDSSAGSLVAAGVGLAVALAVLGYVQQTHHLQYAQHPCSPALSASNASSPCRGLLPTRGPVNVVHATTATPDDAQFVGGESLR
jgi:negative regulator of sigma E activity